jgi:hypothetical protein
MPNSVAMLAIVDNLLIFALKVALINFWPPEGIGNCKKKSYKVKQAWPS